MHTCIKTCLAASVTVAALTLCPQTASAYGFDRGEHASGFDIEPHMVLGYGYNRGPGYDNGIGFGVRFGAPLAPAGILEGVNDSLVLSFGADLTYWSGNYHQNTFWGTSELLIPVMLQWNFYLTRSFSIFPEGGVAFGLGGCTECSFYAAPGFALGARIHFDGRAGYPALVFRVGFPVGITVGILL